MLLSTVPFLCLIVLLAILGIAIIVVAIPGNHPVAAGRQAPPREQGVANRGWFQEAQKEMHR
ncbi:MAG: hypothetical protein ACTHKE_07835 [Sphingomicrobium sp.]